MQIAKVKCGCLVDFLLWVQMEILEDSADWGVRVSGVTRLSLVTGMGKIN